MFEGNPGDQNYNPLLEERPERFDWNERQDENGENNQGDHEHRD